MADKPKLFLAAGWDVVPVGHWLYARKAHGELPKGLPSRLRIPRIPSPETDLLKVVRAACRGVQRTRWADELAELGILTCDTERRGLPNPRVARNEAGGVDITPTSGGVRLIEAARSRVRDRGGVLASLRVRNRVYFVHSTDEHSLANLQAAAESDLQECTTFADVVIARSCFPKRWPGQTGFWESQQRAALSKALMEGYLHHNQVLVWGPEEPVHILEDHVPQASDYVVGGSGGVSSDEAFEGIWIATSLQKTPSFSLEEEDWLPWSVGAGVTRQEAEAKCISETVERYAASSFWPRDADLKVGSWQSMSDSAIYVPGITSTNLEETDWSKRETLWTQAKWLLNGEPILVPLQMVTLKRVPERHRLPLPVTDTAGMAAHMSREIAIRNAICEAVERNSLLEWWRNDRVAARLTMSTLPRPIEILVNLAKRRGFDTTIIDVSVHGLPTFIAFAFDETGQRRIYAKGSAAAQSGDEALFRAMVEMLASVQLNTEMVPDKYPDFQGRTPEDHILYHSEPKRARALLRALEGVPPGPFTPRTVPLDQFLISKDARPVVVDLGCFGGTSAVKVFIPSMPTLGYGWSAESLRTLGAEDRAASPHPFG